MHVSMVTQGSCNVIKRFIDSSSSSVQSKAHHQKSLTGQYVMLMSYDITAINCVVLRPNKIKHNFLVLLPDHFFGVILIF